jgi:hypothetical protein
MIEVERRVGLAGMQHIRIPAVLVLYSQYYTCIVFSSLAHFPFRLSRGAYVLVQVMT